MQVEEEEEATSVLRVGDDAPKEIGLMPPEWFREEERHLMRKAIRGPQRSSEVLRGHQR